MNQPEDNKPDLSDYEARKEKYVSTGPGDKPRWWQAQPKTRDPYSTWQEDVVDILVIVVVLAIVGAFGYGLFQAVTS